MTFNESESICTYDALDESVLSRVMFFLPFRERVKCERVSRLWRKVSLEVNAKQQTTLSIIGERVNKNINQNYCSTPSHKISKLFDIIERTDKMTDLTLILKKVPNLRSLHLKADEIEPIMSEEEAHIIPKLLPELEHFSLCDEKVGWNIYGELVDMVTEMAQLIHLEFKFPCREGASSTKGEMLPENCILKDILAITKPNLEILSCNVPMSLANCKTLAYGCTKLRKLSIIGASIAFASLKTLVEEGRGKYLRILNISIESQEQLKIICSNMLCLHSFHCVIDVEDVNDIGCIGQLKNLKNLFLSCWTSELLDGGLSRIFFGTRNLTSLIINGECSDRSFERMSDFCEDMRRIEINNGKEGDKITDRTMYAFTKLRKLKSLSIFACAVSDASVQAMLTNCSKLNTFCIRRNPKLSKQILPVCIEFASAKKKNREKIYFTLPLKLKEFWPQYLEYSVPSNLHMKFES